MKEQICRVFTCRYFFITWPLSMYDAIENDMSFICYNNWYMFDIPFKEQKPNVSVEKYRLEESAYFFFHQEV